MQEFKVEGMTCAHCVRAVERAVGSVDPGADVVVDLAAGTVCTSSAAPAEILARAIVAEGYRVTSA